MSTPPRRLKINRRSQLSQATSSRTTPCQERAVANFTRRRLKDCRYCHQDHALRKCNRFRQLSVLKRIRVVRILNYCFNCLAHSHVVRNCRSRNRCNVCLDEHHTLLHQEFTPGQQKRTNTRNRQLRRRLSQGHNHAQQKNLQLSSARASASSNAAPTIVINVTAKS